MKFTPKLYTELSQVTYECNNSSWTQFYNIDLNAKCKLESLMVNSDHDHKIKILLDDVEIFNNSIEDFINNDIDEVCELTKLPYFNFYRNNYQYFILKFDFSMFKIWGSNFKIFCQRIDNKSKDLSINNVILIYQEQI